MNLRQSPVAFAEVNGAHLRYQVAGAGPPLVLVHARIADSRMWTKQWTALAERFTVIRYDLRGHGESGMPSGLFSHVADLASLLQYLNIERAAVLGASMGGEIAIDFALAYPDMVAALIPVACAPGGYQWSEAMGPKWGAIFSALEQGDFESAVELELQLWVDGPRRTPEQVDQTVREHVREMDLSNWRALAEYRGRAQGAPPAEPPAIARLAEIQVPTLVVVGDADEPDILAGAEVLSKGIPGAEKAVIVGAGHMLTMEQPTIFNQAICTFLSTHTW